MAVIPVRNVAEAMARIAGYPNAKAHAEAMKRAREFYRETVRLACQIRDEREAS